jgi:hypothetical protein
MRSASSLAVLALCVLAPAWTQGAPPLPSHGAAVVDGNPAEWNLAHDFFTDMYRAGKITKPVESRAHFRYDCESHILSVLVLTEPGIPGVVGTPPTATSWAAIDAQSNKVVNEFSGNDGTPPDFAWVGLGYDGNPGHALGYEASFRLDPGAYNVIIHAEVFDAAALQTSATPGFPSTGPPLAIDCTPVAVHAMTWSRLKALYK